MDGELERGGWGCRSGGGGGGTIWRPLMPTMKSNHGSIGISSFLLRNTWKPNAPWPSASREGESESSRDMKRFSAPNIVGGGLLWSYEIGCCEHGCCG